MGRIPYLFARPGLIGTLPPAYVLGGRLARWRHALTISCRKGFNLPNGAKFTFWVARCHQHFNDNSDTIPTGQDHITEIPLNGKSYLSVGTGYVIAAFICESIPVGRSRIMRRQQDVC
jgi:hypothetical protein